MLILLQKLFMVMLVFMQLALHLMVVDCAKYKIDSVLSVSVDNGKEAKYDELFFICVKDRRGKIEDACYNGFAVHRRTNS